MTERRQTKESHQPPEDELYRGYTLSPRERVAISMRFPTGFSEVELVANATPDKRLIRGVSLAGKRGFIAGRPMAEIVIGSRRDSCRATLLLTGMEYRDPEKPLEPQHVLVFDPTPRSLPFTIVLKRGETQGVGRDYDQQNDLPISVSRDHCAVGLDEDGRFIIENHEPRNFTSVRLLGGGIHDVAQAAQQRSQ